MALKPEAGKNARRHERTLERLLSAVVLVDVVGRLMNQRLDAVPGRKGPNTGLNSEAEEHAQRHEKAVERLLKAVGLIGAAGLLVNQSMDAISTIPFRWVIRVACVVVLATAWFLVGIPCESSLAAVGISCNRPTILVVGVNGGHRGQGFEPPARRRGGLGHH